MQIAVSTLAWIGFCIFILIMLAIDLGVFNRRPHEITYKDAAIWSAVWVALALIFAGLLFGPLGWEMFGAARHQKRSEEHTSELQSHVNLVCRLLLEKKKINEKVYIIK